MRDSSSLQFCVNNLGCVDGGFLMRDDGSRLSELRQEARRSACMVAADDGLKFEAEQSQEMSVERDQGWDITDSGANYANYMIITITIGITKQDKRQETRGHVMETLATYTKAQGLH